MGVVFGVLVTSVRLTTYLRLFSGNFFASYGLIIMDSLICFFGFFFFAMRPECSFELIFI